MDWVPTQNFVEAQAADMLAGQLAAAEAILFTNSPPLGLATVLADLVQPTFGGYAPVTITWADAWQDANGDIILQSQALFFQPTTTANLPLVIFGAAIMAPVGVVDTLKLAAMLDTPFTFEGILDALTLLFRVRSANGQIWGSVVQVP